MHALFAGNLFIKDNLFYDLTIVLCYWVMSSCYLNASEKREQRKVTYFLEKTIVAL